MRHQDSTPKPFRPLTKPVKSIVGATLMGLAMTIAAPAASAPTAYSEFVKALNIIEQTQLQIFTDTAPPSKEDTIKKYQSQLETAKAALDSSDRDYKKQEEELSIKIMRQLLYSTVDTYNDQYANYIYPEALKKYNSRRNGKFVGVGLKFRASNDDYPQAIGALSGGPMDGKNIQPGDKLISVNDKTLLKLSSAEIVESLKGPENSIAKIEVQRGDNKHVVSVKRSAVELHYVDSKMLEQSIGYLKVSRFGSNTHVRFEKQLTKLIRDGATSFVVDLRDNPGGSTRAARAIVSMFSKEKNVYCERYKSGATKQLPRHGEHITDLPLAVLINGKSMSSSEIVAGAIQSYERGVIVGAPSYGKGLVQKVFNLSAPLGGAVRTTIAMFGRPDHQLIQGSGVVPDVYVKTDSDFMFHRTGSLNISEQAKAFQRKLLEIDVKKDHPERASEYIAAADLQLQTAINKLLLQVNNTQ